MEATGCLWVQAEAQRLKGSWTWYKAFFPHVSCIKPTSNSEKQQVWPPVLRKLSKKYSYLLWEAEAIQTSDHVSSPWASTYATTCVRKNPGGDEDQSSTGLHWSISTQHSSAYSSRQLPFGILQTLHCALGLRHRSCIPEGNKDSRLHSQPSHIIKSDQNFPQPINPACPLIPLLHNGFALVTVKTDYTALLLHRA